MKSNMLERLADKLCTCGYLLPSVHAVEPEAHHEDCPYRVLFSIGLYHHTLGKLLPIPSCWLCAE